ncbi:ATP-dependent endonuclease [uncultured Pseudokineococcus sp.]|uniref:ATP-dependent nuclease n=1 Tax=uncultured Pseudokineococcus sp. TaxID=1642928 RepID=UPI002604C662|nr:ATP-binding protein [uncultured Pseudokineococcus sp.]
MELQSLRVRNYRTIGATEQIINLGRAGAVLVGPNNSGKTNLLRAVQLFFTGHDNVYGYDRKNDLTFNAGNARTSLVATFSGDDNDKSGNDWPIFEALDKLHARLGRARTSPTFSLSLQFANSGVPTYQFFPNVKQPGDDATRMQFSRSQKQLVSDLLGRFSLHYVPSARSISDLYEELLVPFMVKRVAETIRPKLDDIQGVLDAVADRLNDSLGRAGLDHLHSSFRMPGDSLERLLTTFDFLVSDPGNTSIFRKGQGIQSTTFLASLLWVTEEEMRAGTHSLWLLEEPESYLHPELSRNALTLLEELRQKAHLVLTTHSLGFVPQDARRVSGTSLTSDGRTKVDQFRNYREATETLRASLGVAFSDFFNLDMLNLLLEGPSDVVAISWAIGRFSSDAEVDAKDVDKLDLPLLAQAKLLDFGGVRHLAGFLRANYAFIRTERSAVAVFDGDEAGVKERSGLQRFFGQNHVPFEANRHYVSVRDRFAIEGLFPDEWVAEIYADHASWFDTYSVDSAGDLEPYRIGDGHKTRVLDLLMARADSTNRALWDRRWRSMLLTLEKALRLNSQAIESLSKLPAMEQGEAGRESSA